jgi:hypothetical protein
MNTELTPQQITRLLNEGSRPLDEPTLVALSKVRKSALEKQKFKSHVWVFAGHPVPHWTKPHIEHPWLIALLLAAALFIGADFWQNDLDQQNCDIDIAILTDELPLEVFLD